VENGKIDLLKMKGNDPLEMVQADHLKTS